MAGLAIPTPCCSSAGGMGLFGKTKEKDPVCGMDVDPGKAAGTATHEGKTYHFCSTGCQQKFKAQPLQHT